MFEYLMLGDVRARKYSKTRARTRSILEKFAFDTTLKTLFQIRQNFRSITILHVSVTSVVSNSNFSSIERVRARVFEYFRARTLPSIRYSNIERDEHQNSSIERAPNIILVKINKNIFLQNFFSHFFCKNQYHFYVNSKLNVICTK